MKKILKKVSLPLYKAAGLGALCACLLWPVVFLLQGQLLLCLQDPIKNLWYFKKHFFNQ